MSCQAVFNTAVQILTFPPIQRRLGTAKTFRFAVIFYTLGYLMYPVTSWMAQQNRASGSTSSRSTYVALGVQIFCLATANIVSCRLKCTEECTETWTTDSFQGIFL